MVEGGSAGVVGSPSHTVAFYCCSRGARIADCSYIAHSLNSRPINLRYGQVLFDQTPHVSEGLLKGRLKPPPSSGDHRIKSLLSLSCHHSFSEVGDGLRAEKISLFRFLRRTVFCLQRMRLPRPCHAIIRIHAWQREVL
jgi:hypothetical protein